MGRLRTITQIGREGNFVWERFPDTSYLELSNQEVDGQARTIYDDGPTRFRPGVFALHPVKQWTRRLVTNKLNSFIIQLYSDPKYGGVGWRDYMKLSGYPLRGYANMRDFGGYAAEDPIVADLVRMSATARSNSPDADVGLMLAEGAETMHLVRNSLSLVLTPWRHLHKIPSYVKGFKRQLSYVASKWLEYRYGVMPLLLDVQSLQDLYTQNVVRPVDEIRKSSAMKYVDKTLILDENGSYTRSAHMWKMSWNYRVHKESRVTCHVYYRVVDRNSENRIGLGFLQLPSLAWELVPYSFVVDWVFNIGDWLKAWQPRPDHIELGNSIGYKTSIISQATLTGLSGYGGNFRNKTDIPVLQATDFWESYTRVIGTPLPVYPQVNYAFESIKHAFDGASLIWQKLANLSKR